MIWKSPGGKVFRRDSDWHVKLLPPGEQFRQYCSGLNYYYINNEEVSKKRFYLELEEELDIYRPK